MESELDTLVAIATHRGGDSARDQRRIGALVVVVALLWGLLSLLLAAANPLGFLVVGAGVLLLLVPLATYGYLEWRDGIEHQTTRPDLRIELTRHHLRIGGRLLPLEQVQGVRVHDVPPWFELQLADERVSLPEGYELDGSEARTLTDGLIRRTNALAEAEDRAEQREWLRAGVQAWGRG